MHNEFTAIITHEGDWYEGYCAEMPEANGQGNSMEACIQNLTEAVMLLLEDRRTTALRDAPKDAHKEILEIDMSEG